jgi:hypothetical protein
VREELDAIVQALIEKHKSRPGDEGFESASPRRPSFSLDAGESKPSTRRSPKVVDPAQSFSDSLSDVTSNINVETRERDLMACRLLKRALIERDTTLMPAERTFLKGLLDESDNAPSVAHASAIESASHTLMSDPLFQFGSTAADIISRLC